MRMGRTTVIVATALGAALLAAGAIPLEPTTAAEPEIQFHRDLVFGRAGDTPSPSSNATFAFFVNMSSNEVSMRAGGRLRRESSEGRSALGGFITGTSRPSIR